MRQFTLTLDLDESSSYRDIRDALKHAARYMKEYRGPDEACEDSDEAQIVNGSLGSVLNVSGRWEIGDTSDKPMALDDRETAEVLHALRIVQEIRNGIRSGCMHAEELTTSADQEPTSCDHFVPDGEPLTNEEIDSLCERFNFSAVGA